MLVDQRVCHAHANAPCKQQELTHKSHGFYEAQSPPTLPLVSKWHRTSITHQMIFMRPQDAHFGCSICRLLANLYMFWVVLSFSVKWAELTKHIKSINRSVNQIKSNHSKWNQPINKSIKQINESITKSPIPIGSTYSILWYFHLHLLYKQFAGKPDTAYKFKNKFA